MSDYESYIRLPAERMRLPPDDSAHPLAKQLTDWIDNESFPCVGAKAAQARNQVSTIVLPDIRSGEADKRLHAGLLAFVVLAKRRSTLFQTFAVIFEGPSQLDEAEFERCMWQRVQCASDRDLDLGHSWDARVSADPTSPHFSLSFAGEAFFVVGLHPRASRPARRFEAPVLVFNMHAQFERLRAEGKYEKLRTTILERDERLAGSPNPMLRRHGEASEACQYSGRAVSPDWCCPFSPGRGE